MSTFVDPAMPEYDGEGPPRPAPPEAVHLAETMVALSRAAERLEDARSKVGDYTGQYEPEHFIRYEQDEYNRAAEAFADAVLAVVARGGNPDVR
jgi:hypothetical protein